jgi:hypothetical protein
MGLQKDKKLRKIYLSKITLIMILLDGEIMNKVLSIWTVSMKRPKCISIK